MSVTAILSAQREQDYFDHLAATRSPAGVIMTALEDISPAHAERLRQCGLTPYDPSWDIEVFQRQDGKVYVKNVRWCGSRYCPVCGPRITSQRSWRWGIQADHASALGVFGYGMTLKGQAVTSGNLAAQLALLQKELKRAYPCPSDWKRKPAGYLGYSWGLEPDFVLPGELWNPHYHALFFFWRKLEPHEVKRLEARWKFGGTWLEEPDSMPAWARYIAKREPPEGKPWNLGLYRLAEAGRLAEVSEYLSAVWKKRLTQPSRNLGDITQGPDLEADDAALLQAADAPRAGDAPLRRLTPGEWRSLWR